MGRKDIIFKNILRRRLDEILLEEFSKENSLINKIVWGILELEYKGDNMLKEMLEQLEADKQLLIGRVDTLEAANLAKDTTIQSLQDSLSSSNTNIITLQEDLAAKDLKIQELEDRIIVLEPEPEPPE